MIHKMPPYELTTVNRISVARATHTRAGWALADAELFASAEIIRKIWGTAARLLVSKDDDGSGETDVTMMVLFDSEGAVLWFNPEEACEYPGTDAISNDRGRPRDDLDSEVIYEIEEHLENAYDATGGTFGALDPVQDDVNFPGWNMLELNIEHALEVTDPPVEPSRVAAAAAAMKRLGKRAKKDGVLAPTNSYLWDAARRAGFEDLCPGQLGARTAKTLPEDIALLITFRNAFREGRRGGTSLT